MTSTSNVIYLKQYKKRKKVERLKEGIISKDMVILMSVLLGLIAFTIGMTMISIHYNPYEVFSNDPSEGNTYMNYYPYIP